MKLTVLYPFMEDAFGEHSLSFIDELVWLKNSQAIDLLITVDKEGNTTEALKKAGLPYELISFDKPVRPHDLYFVALYKLIRCSLSLFFYFKARQIDVLHCPDLLSLLCWGNVAKMNRVPFITSVQINEKISHYARLMLADSRKIVCRNEEVRSKMPKRFSSVSLLDPLVKDRDIVSAVPALRKGIVDFWVKLYVSLFLKPDLNKITGILNKN